MVLGKLPVPGRPTIWITLGQGPTALAVGAGGGCLDIFTLIYPFSLLSPSLWETARYRLKYCLKGPLNPKQPTNQPTMHAVWGCIILNGWSNIKQVELFKLVGAGLSLVCCYVIRGSTGGFLLLRYFSSVVLHHRDLQVLQYVV